MVGFTPTIRGAGDLPAPLYKRVRCTRKGLHDPRTASSGARGAPRARGENGRIHSDHSRGGGSARAPVNVESAATLSVRGASGEGGSVGVSRGTIIPPCRLPRSYGNVSIDRTFVTAP